MNLFWNLSPKEQFQIAKDNPALTIIGVAIGLAITVILFALHAVI